MQGLGVRADARDHAAALGSGPVTTSPREPSSEGEGS
jgi:hypothetical protein